jgi:hypothetical protein
MSIGELFQIKRILWKIRYEEARLYYPLSFRFALLDTAISFSALLFNPYRLLRKRGSVYGETPLETYRRIAAFCDIRPSDTWLELGSGRGRGCFWMGLFIGCRSVGIERVAPLVYFSKLLSLAHSKVRFVRGDLKDADFSSASCVYLYSTCMSEKELQSVTKKMEKLPKGAKVVTISSPLPTNEKIALSGTFPVRFPWGDSMAYLHIVN